jgi:MoxR-like ATPase
VLATQNPIDMEGTYPLPEAQLDRFMFKVDVPHQDLEALIEILDRTTRPHEAEVSVILDATILKAMRSLAREVLVSRSMLRYAAQLCQATHPDSPSATDQARRFVRFGSSPRGAQAIVRAAKARALSFGRPHVDPEDIRACATPALRHRVLLNFEGEAEGATSDQIVAGIVAAISDTDPETRALLSA